MYLTHFGVVENVNELAEKLIRDIQQYSEIAISTPLSNTRVEQITKKLTDYTLNDIVSLGSKQNTDALVELLKTDIDLNAQGLDVWLKRREKHQ